MECKPFKLKFIIHKMNTKVLMIVSAINMGVAGMILSFLPQEISNYLNFTGTSSVFMQILGALYFGFAMLNWTAKVRLNKQYFTYLPIYNNKIGNLLS